MSYLTRNRKRFSFIAETAMVVLLLFCLSSCKKEKKEEKPSEPDIIEPVIDNKPEEPQQPIEKEKKYNVKVADEGEIIFYSSSGYYRYGPSIMEYEDGSMDMWLSSPGNSGSQWDWIIYRHSDDGENWGDEEIVMKPTPGSKDQCSVCDPAVIYFNDYYYLGYTATDYYEGKGSYNMAFVARSRYPDGPFEKWNGSGWGGDPEPIIFYDGGKDNWGIGEVSFVISDDDLFIFYSYLDVRDGYIGLCKADLTENWPSTIRNKGAVLYRLDHDSVEVIYDDYRKLFVAFSIYGRMSEGSLLKVYVSENGKEFREVAETKEYIEDYAHNLGVAKGPDGHQTTEKELLFGYAYGQNWGRWNLIVQKLKLEEEAE